MSYTKTTWVDNSAPAINAENLNKIEQGIYDATEGLAGKVDKVTGKELSSNDFTDAEKTKLEGIDLSTKQDTLVSGTNIKTVNGTSLLGPGNIVIEGGGGGGSENIADEYSASSTYAVDDYCIYDGQLYRCTTAITTAEAWTAAHWTMVTVGEELTDLKGDIPQNVSELTNDSGFVEETDLADVATSGDYDDLINTPTNVSDFTNDANYQTASQVATAVSTKQDTLVSGTNIKTVNGNSLLGSGNLVIGGGGGGDTVTYTPTVTSGTELGKININGTANSVYTPTLKTINGVSVIGTGDIQVGDGLHDVINNSAPINNNYINLGNVVFGKTWGESVGVSTPFDTADYANTGLSMNLIPVKTGDTLYVGHDFDTTYSSQGLFGVFFWDTNYKFIKRVNYTNKMTVTDDGYATVMLFGASSIWDVLSRRYYANLNRLYGYVDTDGMESMLEQTDGYAPVEYTLQNGYYDDGVFTPSSDYQVAVIPCVPGDVFKVTTNVNGPTQWPCAWYYNSQMRVIGGTDRVTQTTHFVNEVVEVPQNCAYLVVHNWPIGFTGPTRFNMQILKKSYGVKTKPLAGKKAVVFGDSITYDPTRWRNKFFEVTGASSLICLSQPGAHLCDYADTVLDGNFDAGGSSNTICNQVYWLLHNLSQLGGNEPDFIIVSAFTNDSASVSSLSEQNDTNVYSNSSGWIDVDTVDRTIPEGAMRWIYSKLKNQFRSAKIIFASPIQSAVNIDSYHTTEIMVAKELKMERVCKRLSAYLIKAESESGITGEFEANNANGLYLADGLHPNANGGQVLGEYYANAVTRFFITGE